MLRLIPLRTLVVIAASCCWLMPCRLHAQEGPEKQAAPATPDEPAGISNTATACPHCLHSGGSCPNCRERDHGHPDLFYNFYVPPTCGQVGAQLYVSPQPVPPLVGHTYITYQPLMPHEFLYPHTHSYYRYYDGGRGMTRTAVMYYYPPVCTAVKGLVHHFRIPR